MGCQPGEAGSGRDKGLYREQMFPEYSAWAKSQCVLFIMVEPGKDDYKRRSNVAEFLFEKEGS